LERHILRKIPMALPMGAAVILAPSVILRLVSWDMHPQELAALISKVDMLALGVLLLYWNLIVAITWGAFIVMVMKGPIYVADSYPLVDADSPSETPLPLGELEAWHGRPKGFSYPGPNVAPFTRNWRWRAHHVSRRHTHSGRGAVRHRPLVATLH